MPDSTYNHDAEISISRTPHAQFPKHIMYFYLNFSVILRQREIDISILCYSDMPSEARKLIDRMKDDARVDYANDWKLLTMFVGGNDLCASCRVSRTLHDFIKVFQR